MSARRPDRSADSPSWILLIGVSAGIIVAVFIVVAVATTSDQVIDDPTTFSRPTPSSPGVVTSVGELRSGGEAVLDVGRAVRLTQPAVVESVPTEGVLWIERGDGRRLLVALAVEGDAGENIVDVAAGQRVTIDGEVRLFPGALEAEQQWELEPDGELLDQIVYIQAELVERVAE